MTCGCRFEMLEPYTGLFASKTPEKITRSKVMRRKAAKVHSFWIFLNMCLAVAMSGVDHLKSAISETPHLAEESCISVARPSKPGAFLLFLCANSVLKVLSIDSLQAALHNFQRSSRGFDPHPISQRGAQHNIEYS